MVKKISLLFCFFLIVDGFSQTKNKSVFVSYTNNPITLDADLKEAEWAKAKGARGFWQYFPSDTIQAKQQANIKFLFDKFNYI